MSATYPVNDAMAVKLFSKEVARQERETLEIAPLIGEGEDNIIQEKMDFSKTKAKGDSISYALRVRMGGDGFSEGEKAQGNAQGLTHFSDSFVINELGQTAGVKGENTIDAQRVPYNLREEGKAALVEWWQVRMSKTFFNQVCGYVPANTAVQDVSGPKYIGFNTVPAATAGRIMRPSTHTTDQAITNADGFVISMIDKAKEMATTGDQKIRPVNVGGKKKYVVYLDPAQVTSLRTTTATGSWQDIIKYAFSGVDITKHPLYNGSLGEWNGCILRESQDVTTGYHSTALTADTDTRRAVLLGAQAAVYGCGGANKLGPMKYRWSEELFDHGRELEIGAWAIFGMKKTQYNSLDFGTLVISTYALRQS